MLALIHLPHSQRRDVHVGKVFVRELQHGNKFVWRPRGQGNPQIWDLNDPRQREDFNARVAELCIKRTIYDETPVPFVFPPAGAIPAPAQGWRRGRPPGRKTGEAWSIEATAGGFVLARTTGDTTLYRGREELWSPTAPPDPFASRQEAIKAAPRPKRPALAKAA